MTLDDVPEDVHLALQQRAHERGHSLHREVLSILEVAARPRQRTREELYASIQKRQKELPWLVNEADLEQYKSEGRE